MSSLIPPERSGARPSSSPITISAPVRASTQLSMPSRRAVPGATISSALRSRGSCREWSSSISSSPTRGMPGMMAEISLGAWFGDLAPMSRNGVSAGDRCSGAEDRARPRSGCAPDRLGGLERQRQRLAERRSARRRRAPDAVVEAAERQQRRARARSAPPPRGAARRGRRNAARRSGRSRRSSRSAPRSRRDRRRRRAAEATASATARSAPGSSIRTPPATLTKTSARAERRAAVARAARPARG